MLVLPAALTHAEASASLHMLLQGLASQTGPGSLIVHSLVPLSRS